MWPWSPHYDFGAADNLENAIKQAAGALGNLMTSRGNWANQYLKFPKNYQNQPGWVGTEYTAWAIQFKSSQDVLVRYINKLLWLAFNVHNASYANWNRGLSKPTEGRTRMASQEQAPRQVYAPPNLDPDMHTQGATPDFLYQYSDNATRLNDQIRPSIWKNLNSAYDQANQPVRDALNGDLSNLVGDIMDCLRNHILELDARVRIVGDAFELAGARPAGDPTTDQKQYVTFSAESPLDTEIANLTPQVNNANDLAQYVQQHGMDKHFWDQLKANQNNPTFMAAFFSALSPAQIESLLVTYGNWSNATKSPSDPDESTLLSQALASAYASGELGPAVGQQIAQWLTSYPRNRFLPAFLNALANYPRTATDPHAPLDPKAAAGFIQSLSDDPQQFDALAEGLGNADYGSQWSADFINVCAAAFKGLPPDQADQLYYRFAGTDRTRGLLASMHPTDPSVLAPALGAFVANYAATKLGPPPPGVKLGDWASHDIGAEINKLLQPFQEWIDNADKSSDAAATSGLALANTVVSLVIGGLTLGIGEVPVDIGAELINDVVIPAYVNSFWSAGSSDAVSDTQFFQQVVRGGTELYVVSQLLNDGRVLVNGSPPTKDQIKQMMCDLGTALGAGNEAGPPPSAQSTLDGWTADGQELYLVAAGAGDQIPSRDSNPMVPPTPAPGS